MMSSRTVEVGTSTYGTRRVDGIYVGEPERGV